MFIVQGTLKPKSIFTLKWFCVIHLVMHDSATPWYVEFEARNSRYQCQQAVTKHGDECQHWDTQTPKTHIYDVAKYYPDATMGMQSIIVAGWMNGGRGAIRCLGAGITVGFMNWCAVQVSVNRNWNYIICNDKWSSKLHNKTSPIKSGNFLKITQLYYHYDVK